eukprot:Blabericola_migrator_1__5258@NODE_26_length_20894_cov_127_933788_g23_i0_p5_GENE_NODE_26_length_20894_cov_127_933788_g23_i0NODE_26_length_20894_cov_127_933788_g23_i0_p5_ORF_typecomplete_len590_score58_10DUF1084/PF06454_11/8_3e11DUF1084/PF06454_11/7_4SID1_RNA_chan/PF13965_6/3_NODE_26_length_20894_cov_127_933788_g23_i019393708
MGHLRILISMALGEELSGRLGGPPSATESISTTTPVPATPNTRPIIIADYTFITVQVITFGVIAYIAAVQAKQARRKSRECMVSLAGAQTRFAFLLLLAIGFSLRTMCEVGVFLLAAVFATSLIPFDAAFLHCVPSLVLLSAYSLTATFFADISRRSREVCDVSYLTPVLVGANMLMYLLFFIVASITKVHHAHREFRLSAYFLMGISHLVLAITWCHYGIKLLIKIRSRWDDPESSTKLPYPFNSPNQNTLPVTADGSAAGRGIESDDPKSFSTFLTSHSKRYLTPMSDESLHRQSTKLRKAFDIRPPGIEEHRRDFANICVSTTAGPSYFEQVNPEDSGVAQEDKSSAVWESPAMSLSQLATLKGTSTHLNLIKDEEDARSSAASDSISRRDANVLSTSSIAGSVTASSSSTSRLSSSSSGINLVRGLIRRLAVMSVLCPPMFLASGVIEIQYAVALFRSVHSRPPTVAVLDDFYITMSKTAVSLFVAQTLPALIILIAFWPSDITLLGVGFNQRRDTMLSLALWPLGRKRAHRSNGSSEVALRKVTSHNGKAQAFLSRLHPPDAPHLREPFLPRHGRHSKATNQVS